MKTVKLYDFDSHLAEFEAVVLSCENEDEKYKITLDKTAFFPESGGQPCDTGVIDGAVVFGAKEKDGEIIHFAKSPVTVGKTVFCKIDFKRRFRFMQNHTGEHIVSGTVYRKFGLDNVSFHLSEEQITVDFNGELSRNQLDLIEADANKAVYDNLPVKAYYPPENELETIEYRSKKELDGDIRIVEIEGVDICACCAPHVSCTGEVGMIKLLDSSRMRGGTRVIIKCGEYARNDYNDKFLNISEISDLLSVKQVETAQAVEQLLAKQDELKQKNSELTHRLIEGMIKASNKEKAFFYEKDFNMRELQLLTDGLHKAYGKSKAAFSGENGKYNFNLCGEADEITELFAKFKQSFAVRGGGRNGMVQGTVEGDIKLIEQFFENEAS